jgi:hypothetical protein
LETQRQISKSKNAKAKLLLQKSECPTREEKLSSNANAVIAQTEDFENSKKLTRKMQLAWKSRTAWIKYKSASGARTFLEIKQKTEMDAKMQIEWEGKIFGLTGMTTQIADTLYVLQCLNFDDAQSCQRRKVM